MQQPKVHCPICNGDAVRRFLRRHSVPVHQHLLFSHPGPAKSIARGKLEMAVCTDCGFVFNDAFDPSLLDYGQHYDNTQTYSPAFQRHIDHLVEKLIRDKGVRDCSIVEVGCGKGDFLRRLVNAHGANNRGNGFDPTYVGPDSELDGRLVFHRRFYDQQCTSISADVVVCRHVIEHISQPLELLQSIRRALSGSPNVRVFFETPCVAWILRQQVAWDLFYEHCALFTADSLSLAFQNSGFCVESVEHVFGGQYLWLEAVPAERTNKTIKPRADGIAELASEFGQAEQSISRGWHQQAEALRRDGGIALWGAGAKGVTFANLVDPNAELMDCVVDANPSKQGTYLPGTGHPVISPQDLRLRDVATTIVLNPNYFHEILAALRQMGLACSVVNLMTSERAVAA